MRRRRLGVSQAQRRVASQLRTPVTPAVALMAPAMHCMHMTPGTLESAAMAVGDGACRGRRRACLAGALLIGLAANAIAGLWWLDPIVGLLIAAVAVKEGAEAWRGDGCCVASPLDGFTVEGEACHDDCCR